MRLQRLVLLQSNAMQLVQLSAAPKKSGEISESAEKRMNPDPSTVPFVDE
jgi:hypothetical protein